MSYPIKQLFEISFCTGHHDDRLSEELSEWATLLLEYKKKTLLRRADP
jgi:hypothetical protein